MHIVYFNELPQQNLSVEETCPKAGALSHSTVLVTGALSALADDGKKPRMSVFSARRHVLKLSSSLFLLFFQVDRKMQERYAAARAISLIPAGEMKDKFWIEWKKSVHDAMEELPREFSAGGGVTLSLTPLWCFSLDRVGATLYLEAASAGRKWQPPASLVGQAVPVPHAMPPNPPFVWNPAQISPTNCYALQQTWINAGLASWYAPRMVPAKTQQSVATKVYVPVCLMGDVIHFATADVSAPDQIHKVARMLPYQSTYL